MPLHFVLVLLSAVHRTPSLDAIPYSVFCRCPSFNRWRWSHRRKIRSASYEVEKCEIRSYEAKRSQPSRVVIVDRVERTDKKGSKPLLEKDERGQERTGLWSHTEPTGSHTEPHSRTWGSHPRWRMEPRTIQARTFVRVRKWPG